MSSLDGLEESELRKRLEKAATYEERSQIRAALRKLHGSSSSSASSRNGAEAPQPSIFSSGAQAEYKRPGFQARSDPPASYAVRHWETLDVLKTNSSRQSPSEGETPQANGSAQPDDVPSSPGVDEPVCSTSGSGATEFEEIDSGHIKTQTPESSRGGQSRDQEGISANTKEQAKADLEMDEAAIRKQIEQSQDYEERKRLRAKLHALQQPKASASHQSSKQEPSNGFSSPVKSALSQNSGNSSHYQKTEGGVAAPPLKNRPSGTDNAWSSVLRKTGVDLASGSSSNKKAASSESTNPWGVMLKKRGELDEGTHPRVATTSSIDYRAQLRRRGSSGQIQSSSTPEKPSSVDYLGQLKRSPAVNQTKTYSSSTSVDYLSTLKQRRAEGSLDPEARTRSSTAPAIDYRAVLKTGSRPADSAAYGGCTSPRNQKQNTLNVSTSGELTSNDAQSKSVEEESSNTGQTHNYTDAVNV